MDIARTVLSFTTPFLVLIIGFVLNRRLKSIDEAQWQSRKIVERRLNLYDDIAPNLNKMFCFCMWVGYWKDVSPADMIIAKREADKTVNIYRHLLSEEFYEKYNEFIHSMFRTFTGRGKDALIVSLIKSSDGDRREDANYEWDRQFEELFDKENIVSKAEISEHYNNTMNALRACMGLNSQY